MNGSSNISARRDYVYNNHRELCKVVEPETGATIMAYDGAGNLAWSKSGSSYTNTSSCNTANIPVAERTIRQYDSRNRIASLSFPDGRGDTDYDYWPDGNLRALYAYNDDTTLLNEYEYNRRRLMTGEGLSYEISGFIQTDWPLNYDYNANGHLLSQSYRDLTVGFAPNALGQPTRAGNFATNASYHPNGAIKEFTYGNGIVHTLTQNGRGLPDTSTDAYNTTKFLADSYDYDANGNVAAITDGATGTNQLRNQDMVYDGLNRLTGVTSPMFGTATYAYDELDNLTRIKLTGSTAARDYYLCYASNTNRLASVRTGSCGGSTVIDFSYDAQGNVASKGGATFDFDYGNRLREAVSPGISHFWYDGHGRRVFDRLSGTGGVRKYSLYTSDGRLIFANDPRREVQSFYVYLGSSLVAIRERENFPGAVTTVKYQHTEALGSPVVVTDANRTVLERREYEPYGQQLSPMPVDGVVGYTGHVFDAATRLSYMQQRYYDPGIGRFISADPVVVNAHTGANFNRYAYANNSPYNNVDPNGESPLDFYDFARDVGRLVINEGIWVVATIRGDDGVAAIALAEIEAARGDAVVSTAGLVSPVPGTGRAISAVKATDRVADANRTASRARGIPDSQLGPSGLPKRHTVRHNTRKEGREASEQRAPRDGRVRNDANPTDQRQGPHFQAEDARGNNVKPVVHDEYPTRFK